MDTGLHYISLEEELSKCPEFTTADQVRMMIDLLTTKDALWQCGTMLIQNILSCLQVEKLLLNELAIGRERLYFQEMIQFFGENDSSEKECWSKVLEAYIIGLAKTTGLALSKFRNGVICPEEDIGLHDFGANFLEHIESTEVIRVLAAAIKWVRSQKKATDKDSDKEVLGAVSDRLEFRSELIYIVGDKKQPKKSHTSLCLELIDKILASKSSLDPAEFDICFTQGIQSRVSNNNPLRALKQKEIDESYEVYKQIINSIEKYRIVGNITYSTDLLSFFVTFASHDVLPLARIFQQVIVQFADSSLLGKKILTWGLHDVKEACGPGATPLLLGSSSPYGIDNSNVLMQIAACFEDLLRSHMFNRARQRQQLSHCIVAWDTLQVATEDFEEQVNQKMMLKGDQLETVSVDDGRGGKALVPALPISSWVCLRKVQIMIWVVLQGFELDIYKVWEYGYMYGYCQYLSHNQAGHIDRTLQYANEAIRKLTLGKQKTKNKAIEAKITDFSNCVKYLSSIKSENNVLLKLSTANKCLCEAAVMAGFASPPAGTSSHTDFKTLFNLRMKPFSSVGMPQLPPFEQLVTASFENTDASILPEVKKSLAFAKRAAIECRMLIDEIAGSFAISPGSDLGRLKRSAVGIAVAATQLEINATKKFTETPESFIQPKVSVVRDNYHFYFPVLTLESGARK